MPLKSRNFKKDRILKKIDRKKNLQSGMHVIEPAVSASKLLTEDPV